MPGSSHGKAATGWSSLLLGTVIDFLEIKCWVLKKLAYNAVLDVIKFPFEVTGK